MATGSCDPVSRRLPRQHVPAKLVGNRKIIVAQKVGTALLLDAVSEKSREI